MSDEKIDLAVILARAKYELENGCSSEFAEDVLALVAAVRAAIVVAADPLSTDAVRNLDAALAPFTDSAEVRDGR